MSNKRLLWIGSVVQETYYKHLCSLGYKNQQAAQIAQVNIINGLEQYYGQKFNYISGPAFPAYPQYRELFIKPYAWKDQNGSQGICASYVNIEYINRLFKAFAMEHSVDKMMKNYTSNDQILTFVNSPHTPYMKAGLRVKKTFPKTKLVLIIPDLPEFMESNPSKFKKFLKSFDIRLINKMMKKFDYYILYSSHMKEFLNLPSEKCITMEGCASFDDDMYEKQSHDDFVFMYSGTADYKFGLKMLVDAFRTIKKDNCKLIITGKGDASEYIQKAAKENERIQYYGFVDDYSKVKQMQADADILMNMRLPSEVASKYCFPSKLFEYMKTGNPVISFRIGGIGEEYYKHLLMVENESVEELANAMIRAISMSPEERVKMGTSAKMFIQEHKNYLAQTKRIYDMIEGIE